MTHLLVVGSGVAGLTAALDADGRPGVEVTLLTKATLESSNTWFAQGGVAVVTSSDDTVGEHVADTLAAGAGLSDDEAVEVLCAEGPEAVQHLIERGVLFDVHDGVLARGLEAAHSHERILHAGGDATGAAIAAALIARLRDSSVEVRENTTAVDLVVERGRVVGVTLLGGERIDADAVVLATGGAGQLYPYTTNPAVATGDGLAMALRAGAVAADLEFYQFHPTSLAAPGNHLVSEAVRGEGAVLIDADGRRFMRAVHPDAELAPRDVVARGIAAQMARQGGRPVRLDATALGAEFLAKRFPTIDAAVRARGFDWGHDPIPVTPAAHYFMGGVRTDLWARTSLPGLFAVGEVACNGLHGANRLASNSLLEGAVYGRRVVDAALDPAGVPDHVFDEEWAEPQVVRLPAGGVLSSRADLQQLMWDAAGLTRDGSGLTAAAAELERWAVPVATDAKSAEDANLRVVAQAVVASALARRESRGGHFRSDFPEPGAGPGVHSTVAADGGQQRA
ncbi:MAG: L-aspartate oxidase [Aeromicrobium sp.]|uniref:L-aspartate oxidase n=1 Tax=Aeromicrobium sp. TaxID=1871063 RepID=UPI0025BCCC21|nr:L-aspartate oxidase [Aeromicrobium sp.]MCK5891100.1 L-aspartate oxidase [Aeromicrobium sp.]MDF1704137.1 L-aspartate oxidase [Aeromicrobium sp.]